ncbi:hypothetical protein [Luteimonas sp. TWI1416]|uniref:hypothetical protein n=1 Tax=unclassified Luteimonas TaxID=2629088 RepID=UPI00320B4490
MNPAYLVVTSLLAAAALWMMTATVYGRGIKLCCALVAAGAIVDVVGLVEAMLTASGYAAIWPGELVLNAGMALLMIEWTRIDRRPSHDPAAHGPGTGADGPSP